MKKRIFLWAALVIMLFLGAECIALVMVVRGASLVILFFGGVDGGRGVLVGG